MRPQPATARLTVWLQLVGEGLGRRGAGGLVLPAAPLLGSLGGHPPGLGLPMVGGPLSVTHSSSEPQGQGGGCRARGVSPAAPTLGSPCLADHAPFSSIPTVRPQPAPLLPQTLLVARPLCPPVAWPPAPPHGPSAHLPGFPTHILGAGTRPEPRLGSGDWQGEPPGWSRACE